MQTVIGLLLLKLCRAECRVNTQPILLQNVLMSTKLRTAVLCSSSSSAVDLTSSACAVRLAQLLVSECSSSSQAVTYCSIYLTADQGLPETRPSPARSRVTSTCSHSWAVEIFFPWCRCLRKITFLWSPYVIGQTIIFLPCDFYLLLLLSSFFLA